MKNMYYQNDYIQTNLLGTSEQTMLVVPFLYQGKTINTKMRLNEGIILSFSVENDLLSRFNVRCHLYLR
ncbi:hypothetical protein CJF42_24025 [Pseudoalteromonas sp. NBT06-2]|nr:hypothetical protein CJF42_24025 [Pseudoalteromonas sp. NBT06-2]